MNIKQVSLENSVIPVQTLRSDIKPDICWTSGDGVFVFTDRQTNRHEWRIVDQIGPEAQFSDYVYFK